MTTTTKSRPKPEVEITTQFPACHSCRMRFTLGPPGRPAPMEARVSGAVIHTLAAFAHEFDTLSDDCDETFTALDFIDWLTPSLKLPT